MTEICLRRPRIVPPVGESVAAGMSEHLSSPRRLRVILENNSSPSLVSKAQFRCCVDGPTEFEVLFESIVDEQFGYNPNSEYKRWVRSLYRLGLILRIPSEWEAPEMSERKSPA